MLPLLCSSSPSSPCRGRSSHAAARSVRWRGADGSPTASTSSTRSCSWSAPSTTSARTVARDRRLVPARGRGPPLRRGADPARQPVSAAAAPGCARPCPGVRAATIPSPRAHSSAGRASRWQREGRRFEPGWVHLLLGGEAGLAILALVGEVDPVGARRDGLDAFLDEKVREGYVIETRTDTHAIISRRPKGLRRFTSGADPGRYVVEVDEDGSATMRPAEPRRS
jgi:hypothetical protein